MKKFVPLLAVLLFGLAAAAPASAQPAPQPFPTFQAHGQTWTVVRGWDGRTPISMNAISPDIVAGCPGRVLEFEVRPRNAGVNGGFAPAMTPEQVHRGDLRKHVKCLHGHAAGTPVASGPVQLPDAWQRSARPTN